MTTRILFIDHSAALGGGELSLLDICRGYRASGTVLLLADGPFRDRLRQEGIDARVLAAGPSLLAVRREGGARWPAVAADLASVVRRLAREARAYDLLYANSQKALVVAALAGRLANRPVIWHLRDILSEEHFARGNMRLVVTLANLLARRVIANSHATADAFVRQGGRREKVTVVHNGIDTGIFAAAGEADAQAVRRELGLDGAPLVGIFGRFHPWKGQHVALEVMARLGGAHAMFVGDALFGEREYVTEVRHRTRDLGLEGRVHFLGFRADLPRLMRASDVVLHTSQAPEPFGRVLLEGMAAGRAVVAARAGGAVEVVEDGVTGLLVTPTDVDGFAAAVSGLLADPARRAAYGRAAQLRAAREFSLESMLAGVSREIELALRERRVLTA